nr:pre-mRNA-splicing factor ATP-dependent RNA helicase DEAH7 [Tanacetum cinerariifolium]
MVTPFRIHKEAKKQFVHNGEPYFQLANEAMIVKPLKNDLLDMLLPRMLRSSRSGDHRRSRRDSPEYDRHQGRVVSKKDSDDTDYRDRSEQYTKNHGWRMKYGKNQFQLNIIRDTPSRSSRNGDHRRSRRDSPEYDRYQGRVVSKKDSDDTDYQDRSEQSDWDDQIWEWEESPSRDSRLSSRHYQPSPSPMLVGAYPDARLVSPWLGGNTPGYAASPWDNLAPSPVPIRASGSVRSVSSRTGGRSQRPLDEKNSQLTELRRYDAEEGNTAYDGDVFYLGDEASVKEKEAEVAKRLVRKDGTPMTLAQWKKLSQLTADNAQWEDRHLMRSGAVRGTEGQTEFDDEEERRVILFVHEHIMPLKDPTSDMAIISKKGSNLVREVHKKQSMNKSHQRFLELAGSKLGNILGVEKSAEQIDADTEVVGEDGEVDFKGEAKFQHLTKGEAMSDFAKSKSRSQRRQYLPILQCLHEDGYTTYGIVGCTQPRRVAAMSVAKRVEYVLATVFLQKLLTKTRCFGNLYRKSTDQSRLRSLSSESLKVENLFDFDFMDPPPPDNIFNAMYQLWVLGALNIVESLTPLGWKMVKVPLDPPLAKMLLLDEQLECMNKVLTIISMLSVASVFFRPKDLAEEIDAY